MSSGLIDGIFPLPHGFRALVSNCDPRNLMTQQSFQNSRTR